jgi:hypothetical protein
LCHISRISTAVGSLVDGSDHPQILSCGTHNMFRWGPLLGPMWIHEIFVWDPHQVGPTHFYLWDPQLKFMFSRPVSEKILTTIFIPNFISKLYYLIFSLRFCSVTNDFSNYIIKYFPSNLCSNFFENSALKTIYLHLWCKSLWLAHYDWRGVAYVSAYVVRNQPSLR